MRSRKDDRTALKMEGRLQMDQSISVPQTDQGKKILEHLFSQKEKEFCLIGAGVSGEGTLNFSEGVIRLDGHWQGKIMGRGAVIIGEKGLFKGEMEVGMLILSGHAEGTVAAQDLAHITATGKLIGKVRTSKLVINEGGIFEGESDPL